MIGDALTDDQVTASWKALGQLHEGRRVTVYPDETGEVAEGILVR